MAIKQTKQSGKLKDIKSQNNLKTSLGLIIAAFTFLLYAQSISFDYTLDDSQVITGNKIVQKGIEGIPTILITDRLLGANNTNKDYLRTPEYRPVPLILLAIEWELFPNNPNIAHLINVLLYALTCWLLFLLLCKLFETRNILFPFICSVLYVAHPIHTEVVDSIKSSDEILCFLFGIISIFFFVKTIESESYKKLILPTFCYFICLMSKETGITFLIIIPLTIFVFTNTSYKRIGRILLFLSTVTGIFLLIRYKVLESIPSDTFILNNNYLALEPDIIKQKATAFFILLRYILLLISPYPLCYDYSFAEIPIHKISDLTTIIAIAVYLIIGVYALIKIRKKDIIAFAILFYLLTIVPVSNIFILIGSPMAERFLYIPSLGFCIAITYFLMKATKAEMIKENFISLNKMISGNSSLFTIVFIILGFYSILTLARNPDWKDNITLYSHDVKISENSARTHFALGVTLQIEAVSKEQNKEMQQRLLDSAIVELTKTINILKIYPQAYINLGICYFNKGDYQNSIKYNEIAKTQLPKQSIYVYNNLAYCYGVTGQFDKALSNADSALLLDSTFVMVHFNKGFIFQKMDRLKDAISENQKVLELDLENVNALKNIARYYKELGDTLKAKEYFERVNRMNGRQQR